MRRWISGTLLSLAVAATCGCAQQNGGASANGNGNGHAPKVTVIESGPEARQQAQDALIAAKPGEIVEFAEGTFDLDMTLSLEDTPGVTIRGQGPDKTFQSSR